MRAALISAIAAVALLGTPVLAKPNDTQEAKLAKALAGRAAGKPVDCIQLRDIDSSQVFDQTAVLYKMRGGDYYLNRPKGAQSLHSTSVLVTDTHTSQLCDVDIVRLVEQGTGMGAGVLSLDEFVPYPRPR